MSLSFDEISADAPVAVKAVLELIESEEYGKALTQARTVFTDACKKKDAKSKYFALHAIAKIHLGAGEFNDAKEVAEKAQQVLGSGDAKQEGAIAHTLAKVNKALCKNTVALGLAEQAMAAFQKAGAKAAEAAVLNTMAGIQLQLQKKQEALKIAKQSVSMFQDIKEKLGEAMALETTAKINVGMRKFEDALRAANEILGIYEGSQDTTKHGTALLAVSSTRSAMGDMAEAEDVARKAVELFETAMDKRMQATALIKLADTCFASNNPTDGWTFVKEARDLYSSVGHKGGEAAAICQVAQAHLTVGNFDEGAAIGEECVKFCREEDLKKTLATVLHAVADGHMARASAGVPGATETHLNSEARKKGKEALAIFQELGDLQGQAKCLNVLSMAFLSYGNIMEGRAKAKAAVQICVEANDKIGEAINLLLVAQSRIFDNKDEAVRIGRTAEKLLKEAGDQEQVKGAEEVIEYIREFDKSGGKKEKEGKTKLSDIQSEKTDITMDSDGKFRPAYFHGFTARMARAAR